MTVEDRSLKINLDCVVTVKQKNTSLAYAPNGVNADFSWTQLRTYYQFGDDPAENEVDIIYHAQRTLTASYGLEYLELRDLGYSYTPEINLVDVWQEPIEFSIIKLLIIMNLSTSTNELLVCYGRDNNFDGDAFKLSPGGIHVVKEISEFGIVSSIDNEPIDALSFADGGISALTGDETIEYFILLAGLSDTIGTGTDTA